MMLRKQYSRLLESMQTCIQGPGHFCIYDVCETSLNNGQDSFSGTCHLLCHPCQMQACDKALQLAARVTPSTDDSAAPVNIPIEQ